MNKLWKIVIIILAVLITVMAIGVSLYVKIIPALISNDKFLGFSEKIVKKTTNLDLTINKPVLTTDFSPIMSFSVNSIILKYNNKDLLNVANLCTTLSFEKIFQQKIIVKNFGIDSLFVDADELSKLAKTEKKKKEKKSNWKVDIIDALLYVKDATVIYHINKDTKAKLVAKNIEITKTHNPKMVKFNIFLELTQKQKKFIFAFSDKNHVYFKDRTLFIEDNYFYINKSKLFVKFNLKENNEYKLKLTSGNINLEDVADLLKTNLIMPNGNEILSPLSDIHGTFALSMNMDNTNLDTTVKLNKILFKIVMLKNLPITLTQGTIKIDAKNVTISDVKGFYGKSSANKLKLRGNVLDYNKELNINITTFLFATKDFSNNYLTPLIGYPLEIVGKMFTKVDFSLKNDIMDITAIFALKKGDDILVDGASMTPVKYDRAFKAILHLANGNLQLKELNYYITQQFKRGVKPPPLLQIFGNLDANNMAIKNIGFKITKPLPSEFLNLFVGERVFRKGKIAGNLEYIATNKIPYLKANLEMDEVRIPAQRLKIAKGTLTTNNNDILLKMNGKFRRTEYIIDGTIANEIKMPFVVKNLNLKLHEVDIEKILESIQKQQEFEAQHPELIKKQLASEENLTENDNDDAGTLFTPGLLIVQNCLLNIVKGSYKEIKFGNVLANMTLDKNGIFEVHSNKFDFADGISTANIVCDLVKQRYKMRLGLKDVDTDIIATSLLDLPREISGTARGLILIDTDKSMKLNGLMKFSIKNGNIATVGLIEYALNFVSLFRNPLVMLSPTTVFDLVNVPEGRFDSITGTLHLKNNTIDRMMIKSSAPQLSSFIVGRYDLENSDATLRIYTKFSNNNKGAAGVLRNVSLNSLAAKVALTSKNDANYYAEELKQLPAIDDEKNSQVFLTKIDGDVEHNNFLSTLKKIK